jgi:GDP-L-fucose synthase
MLSHLNVGTGVDCSIRELAETVARVTGFGNRLVWDATKPDGAPRKLMAAWPCARWASPDD